MGEFTPAVRSGAGGRTLDARGGVGVVLPARAGRGEVVGRGERGEPYLPRALERDLAVVAVGKGGVGAAEVRTGRIERVADEIPETVVVEVVVAGDDEVAAGHLGHEMMDEIGLGETREAVPSAAVGADDPERELAGVAQPVLLPAREGDAAVEEHLGVEGHGEVEMADLLDVGAVRVHREKLHHPLAAVELAGRDEIVAVGGEDDPAAGRPGAAGVEHADPRVVAARAAGDEAGAVAGVRGEGLGGEADELSGAQMQLVEIGPGPREIGTAVVAALRVDAGEVVIPGEEHPLAVEGDVEVRHRARGERLARRGIDLGPVALLGEERLPDAVFPEPRELRSRVGRQGAGGVGPDAAADLRARPEVGRPHVEQIVGERMDHVRPDVAWEEHHQKSQGDRGRKPRPLLPAVYPHGSPSLKNRCNDSIPEARRPRN